MFEESDVKEPKRGASFWLLIGGGVILVLVALNVIRVNRTEPVSSNPTPVPVAHTEGELFNARLTLAPGEFHSQRVNFNYPATIKGDFRVVGGEPWTAFYILNESNFEKWRSGQEFTSETATGKVPVGKIVRKLEHGVYFLVFDNRGQKDKAAVIDAKFGVE